MFRESSYERQRGFFVHAQWLRGLPESEAAVLVKATASRFMTGVVFGIWNDPPAGGTTQETPLELSHVPAVWESRPVSHPVIARLQRKSRY